MAFVNERLTEQQRDEFAAMGIMNPTLNQHGVLRPLHRTIERATSTCLIHTGVYRDCPDEHYFLFFWRNNAYPLSLMMDFKGSAYTVCWDNKRDLSPYMFTGTEPYTDDLKTALMTFKWDGTPSELNEKCLTKCMF